MEWNPNELTDSGVIDLCEELVKGFIEDYKEAVRKDRIFSTKSTRANVEMYHRLLDDSFYQSIFDVAHIDSDSIIREVEHDR